MRSRPFILVGAGAATLGIGAMLWLARGRAPTPSTVRSPVSTTAAASASPGLAAAADPGGAARISAGPDTRGNSRRILGVGAPRLRHGPTILVLSGQPPAPVADIEVAWVDREQARARQRALAPIERARLVELDLPHRFGRRARTGADGRLQLPPLSARAIVAVLNPRQGLFAGAVVRPGPHEVTLKLRRDEQLSIRVRGPDDTPRQAVTVVVYQGSGFAQARRIWSGTTDHQGMAIARHFQLVRRPPPGTGRGRTAAPGTSQPTAPAPPDRFAAAIALPLSTPVAVEFGGRPAPPGPIELRLPAAGELIASIEHHSGAALLSESSVFLVAVRQADFTLDLPIDRRFDVLRADKKLGEQPVHFAHLGRGIQLQPLLRFPGQRRTEHLAVLTTDTAPVPQHLVLQLPQSVTVVAGRAMPDDGAPPDGSRIAYAITTPNGTLVRGHTRTLADGRFDFVCRPSDQALAHRLVLRWTNADELLRGAERQLGALRAGERRDLGDLRLDALPPLLQGRVTDDHGAPIEAARISAQHLVQTARGPRWVGLPHLGVQSDADGSFAMFGTAPPEPMRLHGEARQHLETDTGPLRAGATIDLRLQREGSLSGRVLLPEWLPRNAASVHVQPIGQEQEGRSWRIRDRNGQFRIRALSPGTYTLTLGVRNLPEPLVALHDVRIAPGENRLPRLQGLDLRSALYRYRLRAVDDRGRLMTQLDGPILWHMSAPNGARQDVGFRWQQGRAEIITAVAFLELTALARGHTPTEVALGPGDHDIYLRRLQPVIMDLPGVRAMAGFARAIRVSMILADDSGLPQSLAGVDQRSGRSFSFPRWELAKSGGGWLDGNDRAHAVLSRNGVYEVVLRLNRTADQESQQVSLPIGRVDVVLDGPVAQTHRLTIDRNRVTEVLSRFELRPQARPMVRRQSERWRRGAARPDRR